jgi:hypothetical protein
MQAGEARRRRAWHGGDRQSKAGGARRGLARQGGARKGEAGGEWRGEDRKGRIGHGQTPPRMAQTPCDSTALKTQPKANIHDNRNNQNRKHRHQAPGV